MEIAGEAIGYAMSIKNAFEAKGYKFLIDSPTNQQFPILTDSEIEKFSEKYSFQYWQKVDDKRSAVRFCTSWATRKEQVEELLKDIEQL
jgi:threonine aldolase